MARLELGTTGIGSKCSASWAPTTVHCYTCFTSGAWDNGLNFSSASSAGVGRSKINQMRPTNATAARPSRRILKVSAPCRHFLDKLKTFGYNFDPPWSLTFWIKCFNFFVTSARPERGLEPSTALTWGTPSASEAVILKIWLASDSKILKLNIFAETL